jgi:hypothetical protein
MKSDYSIIHRSQNIGSVINRLHKEELLCVIIQDKGSTDDMLQAIDWYKNTMNFSIHVALNNDKEKLDRLTEAHPDITYLVFNRPVSMAARINAMATECYSTYFLVVRSDAQLLRFDGGALIDALRANPQICCITPVVKNQKDEVVPTLRVPDSSVRNEIRTQCFCPDGSFDTCHFYDTLYPFWGLGLYKRAVFQRLRGMDERIHSSYWQSLDFGTRSWLFGFPVVASNSLQVKLRSKLNAIEDLSKCDGIDRCYAKVLGMRQVGGRNYLERWPYHCRARLLREEVKPKLSLYKTDYDKLCQGFRKPEDR